MIEEIVNNLSDDQKLIVIDNYESLKVDGFIGNCLLRDLASKCNEKAHSNIVFWMEKIVFEIYHYFALKYLDIKDNE